MVMIAVAGKPNEEVTAIAIAFAPAEFQNHFQSSLIIPAPGLKVNKIPSSTIVLS
jgi:hypothetical protein